MPEQTSKLDKPDIYIGIMSGTSLDGVDVAAVRINHSFEFIGAQCFPIPSQLRSEILSLTLPTDNEIDRLGVLDQQLGRLFAACTTTFISNLAINNAHIAAIGSHGQTIRHRPSLNFTLQIGDPNVIAEHTGITTVADFRRRDIASGGQGAPLVPAFHHNVFLNPSSDRVIVNIGGMSNITLLSAKDSESLCGFDTGPGNVLLDSWIYKHTGNLYDKNGEWAATGRHNPSLLDHWLKTPYFSEPPPKSTGRELFNLTWIEQGIIDTGCEHLPAQDIQATLLELTACTIAQAINNSDLIMPEVYLCGGGAHNALLLARIKEHTHAAKVSTTTDLHLEPDWVEAAAFAWLAHQAIHQRTGNHPAVTGAVGHRILGGIYQA